MTLTELIETHPDFAADEAARILKDCRTNGEELELLDSKKHWQKLQNELLEKLEQHHLDQNPPDMSQAEEDSRFNAPKMTA